MERYFHCKWRGRWCKSNPWLHARVAQLVERFVLPMSVALHRCQCPKAGVDASKALRLGSIPRVSADL